MPAQAYREGEASSERQDASARHRERVSVVADTTKRQQRTMTSAKLHEALDLIRDLIKKYPNESDGQIQSRFTEKLVRDPAMQEAFRRDILADLLRVLEDGKAR